MTLAESPRTVGASGVDEVLALDRLTAQEPQDSVRAVLEDAERVGVMECDDLLGELRTNSCRCAG